LLKDGYDGVCNTLPKVQVDQWWANNYINPVTSNTPHAKDDTHEEEPLYVYGGFKPRTFLLLLLKLMSGKPKIIFIPQHPQRKLATHSLGIDWLLGQKETYSLLSPVS